MQNRIILFVLLLSVFLMSCGQTKKGQQKNENNNSVNSLKYEIVAHNSQSAAYEPSNKLILSQKEYEEELDRIFKDMDLSPDRPKIDFEKKAVILICFGECNKGGHDLQIQSVEDRNGKYIFNAQHLIPGKNCVSTMAIEFPYWIIAVDKTNAETAVFNIEKITEDCE